MICTPETVAIIETQLSQGRANWLDLPLNLLVEECLMNVGGTPFPQGTKYAQLRRQFPILGIKGGRPGGDELLPPQFDRRGTRSGR